MSQSVLSARNLRKVYPGKKKPFVAIDNISFDLKEGEILGLLGPNGSGKTTTIQILLGTLSATSGCITYFGKNFFGRQRSEILQKVAFASTYTSLPWTLTVEENLEIFGNLYGLSHEQSIKQYTPLLERFGILDKRHSRISALSAGQVTRVMLVKAFFIRPKIVLLDEPTASLDPDIAGDIRSFLLEKREQEGVAMIFCSHKMEEVTELCDRAVFLKGGRVIADDLPENLANSISTFRVKLVVADGLKRTLAIIEQQSLQYSIDHRLIEVVLDEEKIPAFLNALSQQKVSYANIKIEEPSLENFFLQIAKARL